MIMGFLIKWDNHPQWFCDNQLPLHDYYVNGHLALTHLLSQDLKRRKNTLKYTL